MLQIAATCKHFAAYSLEQEDGITRMMFNAVISDRLAAQPQWKPGDEAMRNSMKDVAFHDAQASLLP